MTTKNHPTIPAKFAGKWIAWDTAAHRIIASGRTFATVRKAARTKIKHEPQMMKVPRGLYVGLGV